MFSYPLKHRVGKLKRTTQFVSGKNKASAPLPPPDQVQLIGFSITTVSGSVLINWGDGTSQNLNSNVSVDKTFYCPSISSPNGFWNNIQPCL